MLLEYRDFTVSNNSFRFFLGVCFRTQPVNIDRGVFNRTNSIFMNILFTFRDALIIILSLSLSLSFSPPSLSVFLLKIQFIK